MGWDSTHYDKHAHDGLVEFFYGKRTPGTNEYVDPHYGTVTQVTAHALVERTEFYAVIRWRNAGEAEFRPWFGAVTMIQWSPKDPNYNIAYKSMEEGMGPVINSAPLKVLKALEKYVPLPPIAPEHEVAYLIWLSVRVAALENGDSAGEWEAYKELGKLDPYNHARTWRERCLARIETRGKVKVKVGDVLQFVTPMEFTRLGTLDTVLVNAPPDGGNGIVLTLPHAENVRLRIPKWRERPFEIIESRGGTENSRRRDARKQREREYLKETA